MPTSRPHLVLVSLLLIAALSSTWISHAAEPSDRLAEIPPVPVVDDPMLAPVPPAAFNLSSWEEALTHLRGRSTDLRSAVDNVRMAEGQWRVALASVLPSLNATGSAVRQMFTEVGPAEIDKNGVAVSLPRTLPTPRSLQATVNFNQSIVSVASWHAIGTAQMAKSSAWLSVANLKRTLALGVANAIVAVVAGERVAELNRLGLRNALERLNLTVRRKQFGVADGLDVVRARQDVEGARTTLVTGDESLRRSREALGLALGYPKAVGVTHDLTLRDLELSAPRTCSELPKVDSRADIAAARMRAKVADRRATNVALQWIPTLSATSQLNTTTADPGWAFPQTLWNIQAVLSVSFWDGGARYGAMKSAQAEHDIAEQSAESLTRQATIQVIQARRGIEVAEQSKKVAEAARVLAEEVDRLTRIGYQEGRGTSLELVTAAASLRQAEITYALREFDYVQSRLNALLVNAKCVW